MKQNYGVSLFVTGVAAYGTIQQVYEYFSGFGNIKYVKLIHLNNQKLAFKITTDNATCLKILNSKNHWIDGRNIQCNLFISGNDLIKKNIKMNKCRIIIKKVPSFISIHQLKNAVELMYGEINTIFQFKSDSNMGTETSIRGKKMYSSYSVLFSKKESVAKIATESFYLHDCDTSVIIEKFQCRRTKTTKEYGQIGPLTNTGKLFMHGSSISHINNSIQNLGIMEIDLSAQMNTVMFSKYCKRSLDHQGDNLRLNINKS